MKSVRNFRTSTISNTFSDLEQFLTPIFTMRRNTVTLLKFLIAAVIFMMAGPVALKFMFGGRHVKDIYVDNPRGMPVAPVNAQPVQVRIFHRA